MRRQENQPARPTAGCLSVPLFNQKKRNRVPLTSAPSENEFFSHTEYMASTSSATSHSTSATLDSAVTLAHHGAKNFLMRDGKEVVQCIFYENEQELPRLIRGQIHRCVGNYDRSRDVLMCVSVRPGLPSELRNAQEAVKACDAEMRALVKSLSEV
eukprot:superscaffoldBa00000122_g1790